MSGICKWCDWIARGYSDIPDNPTTLCSPHKAFFETRVQPYLDRKMALAREAAEIQREARKVAGISV